MSGYNAVWSIQRRWRVASGSVKQPPAKQETLCSAEDLGSIPGSARSPGEGNGNLCSILAWGFPWTEKPSGLHILIHRVSRVKNTLAT